MGDAAPDRLRHALAVALITVLIGLTYCNTLVDGFVFDDVLIVKYNPLIRDLKHLPTLFSTHYWAGAGIVGELQGEALYRPLVLTTYMLNALTTGLRAWAFHLTNVMIHLSVVITLYGIACRLGLRWPGALAAAAVFAVHPLNTEAVTGIVGRAELMMALGVLLAFYWDLRKNPPQEPATKVSFAALAFFALGLWSKEQAMMFLGLILVADGMRMNRSWRGIHQILWHARLRYAGYLAVLGLYLAARFSVIGTAMPPLVPVNNPLVAFDAYRSLLNAVKVAGVYLRLVFWPQNLSADYSFNSISMSASALDPAVWLSALAWSALLTLGALAFTQRRRPLAIGIAITFLFFLPVSNLIVHIGTIMGERLFYLPLAGLCLALGWGWHAARESLARRAPRWRVGVCTAAAVLALAPLSLRTITRNRDWESNAMLFASAVRTYPNNAKARFLMGTVLVEQRKLQRALTMFESALAILPEYTQVIKFSRSYAGLLLRLGRADEAIGALEEARAMNPGVRDPWIQRLLAIAYELKKNYALAAASLERAIAIERRIAMSSTEPLFEDINQLARLYALDRKRTESRRALEDALKVARGAPDLPESRRAVMTAQVLGNLALLDMTEGEYAEAEEKYVRMLEVLNSPGLEVPKKLRAERLRDYARLLHKMGRIARAETIDREAASLEAQ